MYDRYGAPHVLRVADVPIPSPAAGQVRIKVAATSVDLSDWECLHGSPAHARIGGLRHPRRRTLGSDVAGVVDDVGPGVTRFRPGDQVYGDNLALKGGFAEYAIAPVAALADKPAGLDVRPGIDHPASGRDRPPGSPHDRGGQPSADQRCRRRVRTPSPSNSVRISALTSPESTTPPSRN